jgi:tRNA modification GTPase
VPGTTRDLVTETIDLDGLRVTLVDTAGVRPTEDEVEAEGVSRSVSAARMADVVVEVHDGSAGSNSSVFAWQGGPSTRVVVDNKADHAAFVGSANRVRISATTGEGLDELRARLIGCLGVGEGGEPPGITNVRRIALLEQARASIEPHGRPWTKRDPRCQKAGLVDLQAAHTRSRRSRVAGRRSVLAHIFERFCIGK